MIVYFFFAGDRFTLHGGRSVGKGIKITDQNDNPDLGNHPGMLEILVAFSS